MLLTLDVGNTNIHYGLFEGLRCARFGAVPSARADALADEIGDVAVARIIMGSVAPSLNDRITAQLAARFSLPALIAGDDVPFGIENQCERPERVGADRLLNAVAAWRRRRAAVIVVDAGSAITVDLVSARGSFCGGAIAAGPSTMLKALHAHTELLPDLEPEGASITAARKRATESLRIPLPSAPPSLGRNTEAALRSGAYWGSVGLVERLVAEIARDQGVAAPPLVTGGAGEFIAREMRPPAEYAPTLTLEGLAILAERG